ncbi:uncharacterized protein LOC120069750 isoform X2 [Benincasa hispida]|uniref:uncharacterized protein LOC120069750 isoform X2 n=1 Tax=Benincasa hispida TaxID=102211 RepID=UPI0019014126|nr:uncharacterized protein LOC120069750 isoform X2 [Benincasa hispida]
MLPCACSYGMRISSDFCTASWAALNYRTTNFHGQIKNNDASRQISCQALNYQELLFLSLEALMKTQNDDVRLKYFKQAEETVQKLDLDSNTNACLLAENFRSKNLKTRVICCPKTIDGDLKCKEVPTCFGFDYACKVLISLCNCFRIHISYGPNFGERCKVEVVSSRIRGKIGMSHS